MIFRFQYSNISVALLNGEILAFSSDNILIREDGNWGGKSEVRSSVIK